MSKSITKSAKTVQAAVELALEELKLSQDKVKITVLEEGSRGLFGIGSKDAIVRVTPALDLESRARDFLSEVFFNMGLKVDIDITSTEKLMNIELSGDSMGIIIGKRGDTLDALEHLTSLCVNRGDGDYIKVVLDTENYRAKRQETLVKLANSLARGVVKNRRKVTLEPMSSNERRIIHSTLQANDNVETYSIGEEPNRRLVIALKKK
ncbi:MAG: protein jag [Clostridia bacterium]|nr:protein jag [Clostridia bacterium]MBQ3553937.1 protein jag [Clostridia bacterium]